MPRLKRLNDAWHARGTACLFHSDGNLWPVLDDLVAAGIDGLNPLEVLAGMTVKAVRERYPQLFLTGGVDVSQLLVYGTPDEVRAACRQNIRDAGGRGYLIGSSTELHWDVALENAVAMFETAWGEAHRTGTATCAHDVTPDKPRRAPTHSHSSRDTPPSCPAASDCSRSGFPTTAP